jgi:ATP/maltotriose-dependent transcriptional regulator MalT
MSFWRGELKTAERQLRDAIRRYAPERHRDHVVLYAQDPKVVCLSRLAWTLWHLGRVTEALACRDEALAMAATQDEPLGRGYALWFTMFIPVEQGDVERLAAQSDELKRVASEHRLLYTDTVADGFLGYVQALRGDARGGIARMRATLQDRRWLGMEYVLKSQTLYLIARAAASAGDRRTAGETVDEALEYLGPGPSVWQAPLRQIGARVAAAGDRTGVQALAAFRQASEIARDMHCAWTALGIAIDRGRWCLDHRDTGRQEARADLARTLAPFADAPPLPAVAAGRIILERLTREGDS